MAIDSDSGTVLSWEQVQQMQLPPNTTVLLPPTPPVDFTVPEVAPPDGTPEWLEDNYYPQPVNPIPMTDRIESPPTAPEDPKAAQAAAERERYGDPALRLLTGLVATNAILERIQTPPKKDEDEKKKK
jgi:hypothetical protein